MRLNGAQREATLQLCSLFHVGEEAVAHDLSPLLIAIRREGNHLEDEMFLAAQLFEEAKHLEWFDRWFDEVVGKPFEMRSFLGDSYRKIFDQELPRVLNKLLTDHSPRAQAEAVVTYHMIIEGVLAETGYHGFSRALKEKNLMPGLVAGIRYVQQDEARHIAFGIYLLQRLVRQDRAIWDVIQHRLNELLPVATELIQESFDFYDGQMPFGLSVEEFVSYAAKQYSFRVEAIERVLAQSP
ncbi:ribonucleotide-diphosphate reductase subunit beta [Candidatus Acetothermia bacterium]|nr:ribonucleotide-diphosphate reductase subunit beta [Candidatus Acetothermia bacterium]